MNRSTSFVNIVISEEPLLQMETCDQVIQAAKKNGVSEREVLDVDEKTDWNQFIANSSSMSLFAELKLFDIRFNKVPNKQAQDGLNELVATASIENQFLIRLPKLDKRQKSTKWFKSVSQNAQLHELWPPKPHEFVNWINQRAAQMQLQLAPEAAHCLAQQSEGNLLAARQSLQKLALLYPQESISAQQMVEVTSDNARYSIFLCLDEALAGKGARAVKMLHKFRHEGVAPIVILVNLTREIEQCKEVALAGLKGISPTQALAKSFLWDSKKRLIATASNRLSAVVWQRLVMRCALLDGMIKGQESGDIWNELELCLWMIAGQRIWGRVG
ncbi:DNA polymerase III subunit delta [Aliikangiella sp. IMCC44653]